MKNGQKFSLASQAFPFHLSSNLSCLLLPSLGFEFRVRATFPCWWLRRRPPNSRADLKEVLFLWKRLILVDMLCCGLNSLIILLSWLICGFYFVLEILWFIYFDFFYLAGVASSCTKPRIICCKLWVCCLINSNFHIHLNLLIWLPTNLFIFLVLDSLWYGFLWLLFWNCKFSSIPTKCLNFDWIRDVFLRTDMCVHGVCCV